ncbi:hypothetical protein M9Y10_004334 [Tritrichomonas musculus]|uniref:Protein-S-isoprenylcysteine O-methyltransferase n=1 Tax=Tritrichomonas musculus TaxID=1915356 RepID=A0ABR2JS32_9EUKA
MDGMMCFQLLSLIFILIFYSVAEYLIQKHFHPKTTKFSSFLLTRDYLIAYTIGFTEYLIERYFFPSKSDPHSIIIYIGLLMEFIGLYIRFSAILHAGKSFNHIIQTNKSPEHKLVTDGIYKYFRHPSYFGFFLFAVGTQVMLKNIFSVIGFIVVLWRFFDSRIRFEEQTLINMFGKDYIEYKKRTPTWIPFIK